ncbi:MAG: FtsX-like permease family protein, partial [Bacteroidia bacterium]
KEAKSAIETIILQLENRGIKVYGKDIPLFLEHPHQWQLNTILFLVGAIGLLTFLMSAVLVSQLMGAIMVSHTRQIGVLKATGATRFQVLKMYVLMLMIIGAVAGIIAVPLALIAGNGFAHFIAGILNFNIYTSPPFWIGVLLMLISISLPIIMSLFKILQGTGIPVRQALSDYGISQRIQPTSRWFNQLKIPHYLVLALRNSLRNRKRVFITVLTMALGVAIFSTGFDVRRSLWNFLSTMDREMNFDVQVIFNQSIDPDSAFAPCHGLENLEALAGWSGGTGRLETEVVGTEDGVGIVALPYNTEYIKPKVIEGKWLSGNNRPEIVLNQKAWSFYGTPSMGTMLNLETNGKILNVKLVGIIEQFALEKIYIDEEFFIQQTNSKRKVSHVLFVAKDDEYGKVIQLKKDIEDRIAGSTLQVASVMSHAEKLRVIYAHLNIILSTILILSFLVLLVSAVGMASATGINIWERTREIGVMRAIGATPEKILQIFVSEGMIVSLVSILLGLILAYPLSKVAAAFFGQLMLGEGSVLRYAFNPTGFWVTLVVTLVFGWIASRFPARNAIQVSTRGPGL